jgi:uncharacterized membrane protein YgcG
MNRIWSAAARVALPLLLAGATACSNDGKDKPGVGNGGDVGMMRLAHGLGDEDGARDVAAVRFTVTNGEETFTKAVGIESEVLPVSAGSPLAGHRFADWLVALEPGAWQVTAEPLRADGSPSTDCAPASGTGVVMPGVTTEIVLVSQCSLEAPGALDTAVAFNSPPFVEALDLAPSKFICAGEAVRIAAMAHDLDDDTVTWSWSVPGLPDGAGAGAFCLGGKDGAVAAFSATAVGKYTLRVEVADGRGGQSSLSFPVHVSDCDAAPVCAGDAVRAVLPGASPIAGVCSCNGGGGQGGTGGQGGSGGAGGQGEGGQGGAGGSNQGGSGGNGGSPTLVDYTVGHADLGLEFAFNEGEFEVFLHAEGATIDGVPGTEAELPIESVRIITGAVFTRPSPDGGLFANLCVDPGQSLWWLPQANGDASAFGVPFMGIANEAPAGVFVGDQVTLSLVAVSSPSGTGHYSMWKDGFPPQFKMSSCNGIDGSDAMVVPQGHDHFNMGFTEVGAWQVTYRVTGALVGGGAASADFNVNYLTQ